MRFQNQVSIALYINMTVMQTQKELGLGSDAVSVILPIGAYTQFSIVQNVKKWMNSHYPGTEV